MKKIKKSIKNKVLALILMAVLLVPSLSANSAIGEYSVDSMGIEGNTNYLAQSNIEKEANVLGAVAGALALAYVTGRAVGTIAHHLYHFSDGHPEKQQALLFKNDYKSNDFTKYDN